MYQRQLQSRITSIQDFITKLFSNFKDHRKHNAGMPIYASRILVRLERRVWGEESKRYAVKREAIYIVGPAFSNQRAPSPPANKVKDRTVRVTIPTTKLITCRSISEKAALQVAH